MIWNEQVFQYCERGLDPGFWGEPLNALTNAAFAGVGIWAWRATGSVHDLNARTWLRTFSLMMGAISLGSFLFHTLATRWAGLADVIPISIFMVASVGTLLRYEFRLKMVPVLAISVAFGICNQLISKIRMNDVPVLNGSALYFLSLGFLYTVGFFSRSAAGRDLKWAAMIFTASVVLRSVDRGVCSWTAQLGTHFLWHLCNAWTLFLVFRALRTSCVEKAGREGTRL